MNWSQVSPSRYERPLTGMEVYTAFTGNSSAASCNGREQYNVFSRLNVDIDLPDVESALKRAWRQSRYEDPDIATTLENERRVYETPNEAAVTKWLESTFVISNATNAHDIYTEAPQINQATLYYLPESSELVFRAPHWVVDGIGLMIWWDKFLKGLTNPKDVTFGDEFSRLVPPMEQALGCPAMPTLEQTETADVMLMGYVASLPSIGPVSGVGKVPAGVCRDVEYALSTETTAAVLKTCKELGVTVTSAIHAAYIQTIVKHADPHSMTSRYTTVAEFNLRRYVPEEYRKVAVSNYYTALYYSTALPAAFKDLVHSLSNFYKTAIRDNPDILELTGEYSRMIGELIKSPEYQAAPIPTDALVSSLGVVDDYLGREYQGEAGRIVVRDFKLALDVVLGMCAMHVYTFAGRLRLVYSFNDGYEEPNTIRGYLEDVERVLQAELLGQASG